MDDFVLVRLTTVDGQVETVWLPPILAVALLFDLGTLGKSKDIYSARIYWMSDQNSRAWDMSL